MNYQLRSRQNYPDVRKKVKHVEVTTLYKSLIIKTLKQITKKIPVGKRKLVIVA